MQAYQGNDAFQLHRIFYEAIPYFEMSDTLRDYALFHNDLIAAYYLRKRGLAICIDTINKLSQKDKPYFDNMLQQLMNQLEDMKKKYGVTEELGIQVIREKCKSAYYACIQYGNGGSVIPRELAFLYSQVVIYLNTLAMLTALSPEEEHLRKYAKYQVTVLMGLPGYKNRESVSSRLGFKEIREEPAPTPAPTSVTSEMEPSAEESNPVEKANPAEESTPAESTPVEESNSNVVDETPIEQTAESKSKLVPEDSENFPEDNINDHPEISEVSEEIAVLAGEITDITNDLAADSDVDVEAELGLPPLVPPPMMASPEQVNNPVVSFAEMNEAGKKRMLDDLINESLTILDSIPKEERTEHIEKLEDVLMKAKICSMHLSE